MRKLPWLPLCGTLLLSSCCINSVEIQLPNIKACAVKGLLVYGANCAETNTGLTSEMTADETVEFLQATDGSAGHAPAIIMSAEDFRVQKDALDSVCRALGSHCTLELQQTIKTMEKLLLSSPK